MSTNYYKINCININSTNTTLIHSKSITHDQFRNAIITRIHRFQRIHLHAIPTEGRCEDSSTFAESVPCRRRQRVGRGDSEGVEIETLVHPRGHLTGPRNIRTTIQAVRENHLRLKKIGWESTGHGQLLVDWSGGRWRCWKPVEFDGIVPQKGLVPDYIYIVLLQQTGWVTYSIQNLYLNYAKLYENCHLDHFQTPTQTAV